MGLQLLSGLDDLAGPDHRSVMAPFWNLRRSAIAIGAALLVIALVWQVAGNTISYVSSRLSADNDPALLKLQAVAAGAHADGAAIRVLANFAATSISEGDPAGLNWTGSAALAFTDQGEPAARSVGIDIVNPAPAPDWLIPCFRDAQAAVQGWGSTLLAGAGSTTEADRTRLARSVEDVRQLADLLDVALSTGSGAAPASLPAATGSGSGGHLVDPRAACQQVTLLRSKLAP